MDGLGWEAVEVVKVGQPFLVSLQSVESSTDNVCPSSVFPSVSLFLTPSRFQSFSLTLLIEDSSTTDSPIHLGLDSRGFLGPLILEVVIFIHLQDELLLLRKSEKKKQKTAKLREHKIFRSSDQNVFFLDVDYSSFQNKIVWKPII